MRLRENPLVSRSVLITVGLVLALLAVQSVRLGREVLVRLEVLSTAATDSLQWTLSQAEIEQLKLENAILSARSVQDLSQVRREFDILYSRVATIRESRTFQSVREAPENAQILQRVMARIDRLITYIDGPDEALLSGLPKVSEILRENRDDLRVLALAGLSEHARATEEKRLNLFAILSRLAWVVLALCVALGLTALMLGRLYQRGRRLAERTRFAVARMRAMITSSLDAILVVGDDGRIQEVNGAAETIFGYSRGEAIGADMAGLIVPDHLRDAHEQGMQAYCAGGPPKVIGQGRVQLEAKRKSGEIFPVELSITASQSAEETVFVSYLRDISERIAAEEELTRTRDEALAGERAKADLLTVMSHEMRTPLTGILGASELLDGTSLSPEQREYLSAIRISGDRLMAHVNDVLQLSQLETGVDFEHQRIFNLSDLVQELVDAHQNVARRGRNDLSLHCSLGAIDDVLGRPVALKKILISLIENALQYTSDGAVSVDVQRLGQSDTVEISIADTGAGIAEHDLDRIFEDFIRLDASYARSSDGTGLGLAITRRIVVALGGEISCESELGEGSLFTIALPLPASRTGGPASAVGGVPTPEQSGAQALGPAPQSANNRQRINGAGRILVVDDNEINRVLVERMLTSLGHHVVMASGGAEGVEAARAGCFDLIFMDISMPEVDGIDASRQIREQQLAEGTQIVALTAHVAARDHARILDAGLAEVVTKPVSRSTLAAVISRRMRSDRPCDTEITVASQLSVSAPEPAATTGQTAGGAVSHSAANSPDQRSDIAQFLHALGMDRGARFLVGYCEEVGQFLSELRSAETLDPALRQEAHRLAGSAAVLGFADLREAFLGLEHAEIQHVPDLTALVQIWDQASQEIAECLPGKATG
ncbi:two-component system hybrid kinase [Phaeobacter piscinae]|uniref:histidine kinase n=1 Tax=Phaeobacter piscinae TaxID=1580596 RepID=A0ABN5DK66_9RHOB|nr:PAS domain-containing hybrid sensor histidine kinase/response regulator [Phaeobacter piscinae]ATG35994.1 two-component system hybrid kinase [Phaeobacter piscinae]AUQ86515.1 two-component system hybrid kinase [Phaeobacter piscinae]AUR24398.1 two-component system hybrid kinase [Phaeobacter piscinae]